MGYYADSIEIDFTVPADKVEAALVAANESEDIPGTYKSLDEFVRELTCFEGSEITPQGDFDLGYHNDKFLSYTEDVLGVLAPFVKDGSYVRFVGEDQSLFGYIVKDGKLEEQYGQITWI